MDWRIGRLIRSVSHADATVNATPLDIIQNNQRVGITIWGSDSSQACIFDPSRSGNGAAGLLAPIPLDPIHITLATHGDLSMRGGFVYTSLGDNDVVYWTEYFAPETMLTLALEMLKREYPGWKP